MRFYACAAAVIVGFSVPDPASAQTYRRAGSWGVVVEGGSCATSRYDQDGRRLVILRAQRGGGVLLGVVKDGWSTTPDQSYPGLELGLTGVTYRNLRSIGVEVDGLQGHAFVLADTFLDHLAATSHLTVIDGDRRERIDLEQMALTIDDLRQCRAATMAD
ncbi:hypothetical protein [Brevundimonas sp.]|uniref:hypothetical protein n=1 Tax=Brevundimonas sp. TaxID=1871086 RepID=UPI002FC7D273